MKKQLTNGAIAFVVVLLCCSLWSFTSIMQNSTMNLGSKILWAKIAYPSHAIAPLAWFIMILQLTGRKHLLTNRNIALLSVVPAFTILAAFTNYHGILWQNLYLYTRNGFLMLGKTYGLWFWIHSIYSDSLNILSVVIAFNFIKRQAPLYITRYACLVFSVLFVTTVNAAYLMHLTPVDLSSIAWGAVSPFIIRTLIQDNLFGLIPIARYHVMENLTTGVILIDLKDRIVDMNQAAEDIFKTSANKIIGIDAFIFFNSWTELLHQLKDRNENNNQLFCFKDGKYYKSKCFLINKKNRILGKILLIEDITKEYEIQTQLLNSQRTVAIQEERERMARDLHDDLGQVLGFINLQSQAIQEYLKKGNLETASLCLERLSDIARQTHNNVRETILEMHGETVSSKITAETFYQKLARELQLFEKNSGIHILSDFTEVNKNNIWFSKSTIQIIKIIREILNNIQKHANATETKVVCLENNNIFSLSISDNGQGFDAEIIDKATHLGLQFMEERTEELGGHIQILSKAGEGTKIMLTIPLTNIIIKELRLI